MDQPPFITYADRSAKRADVCTHTTEGPAFKKDNQMANRHTTPIHSGRPCNVSGCTRVTTTATWRGYCNRHLMAHRKYGDPEQRSITKGELRPYREAIQKAVKRNPQVDWQAIYARWPVAVGIAQEALQTIRTGIPHLRYNREAAQMICDIAGAVEPSVVFEIVSAMWLLQEVRGGMVKSDNAFKSLVIHALQREGGTGRKFARPKWRPGMSLGAIGQTVTYSITSQRTRSAAYEYISRGIGGAAVAVAKKEMARHFEKDRVEAAYKEAVAAIV
jgi:hypothetical protein